MEEKWFTGGFIDDASLFALVFSQNRLVTAPKMEFVLRGLSEDFPSIAHREEDYFVHQ